MKYKSLLALLGLVIAGTAMAAAAPPTANSPNAGGVYATNESVAALETALADEIAAREAADAAEQTSRISGDAQIQSRIDELIGLVNSLSTALDEERSDRQSADKALNVELARHIQAPAGQSCKPGYVQGFDLLGNIVCADNPAPPGQNGKVTLDALDYLDLETGQVMNNSPTKGSDLVLKTTLRAEYLQTQLYLTAADETYEGMTYEKALNYFGISNYGPYPVISSLYLPKHQVFLLQTTEGNLFKLTIVDGVPSAGCNGTPDNCGWDQVSIDYEQLFHRERLLEELVTPQKEQ